MPSVAEPVGLKTIVKSVVAGLANVAVIAMVRLSSSSLKLIVESVTATAPFPSSPTNPNCSATTYPEAAVAAAMNRFSFIEFSINWSSATLYIFTTLSLTVAPSLYAFTTFFEKF